MLSKVNKDGTKSEPEFYSSIVNVLSPVSVLDQISSDSKVSSYNKLYLLLDEFDISQVSMHGVSLTLFERLLLLMNDKDKMKTFLEQNS